MRENVDWFWPVIVLMMFVFGMTLGVLIGTSCVRHKAVEHGVAEWRCDPATGETEFVWLAKGE